MAWGKDTVYGSNDNDYFFIDADFSGDNSNNIDIIKEFYVAGLNSAVNDWLVFSAAQLGLTSSYMKDELGWDEGALSVFDESVSTYKLDLDGGGLITNEHWFKVDGIDNYDEESMLLRDSEPAFILDYSNGDLYYDGDGDRDVGDQVLVAQLLNTNGDNLAHMHANQILVVENYDFFDVV